jgi:hypothetical protein
MQGLQALIKVVFKRLRWVYRFAASTALFNLAWEILQLPLYTLWVDASPGNIALDVLHCTAGDVLIAGVSLVVAVALAHRGAWSKRPSLSVWLLALLFGWAYTVHSEWYNTTVTHAWAYSVLMPQMAGIGLAPLVQWLVVPGAVFWWVQNHSGETHVGS